MTTNTDWIEWAGGECPVPGDTVVDVRLTRGEYSGLKASDISEGRWAGTFLQNGNIIAYRIVKP